MGTLFRVRIFRHSWRRADSSGWTAVVAGIVGALENALVVGGLSALGAGLYGLGIPKDSVVQYEKALQSDQFVLVAQGTAAEVAHAKHILGTTQPSQCTQHSPESLAA